MGKGNIISDLFSSIFSAKDPEAAKKKLLKSISKELSKCKYHYYKASSHEVQPSMAKTFYEIYKVISPAQIMFQNTNPASLKHVVISASLTEKQREVLDNLSEESIFQQAKTLKLAELKSKVKSDYNVFASEFDSSRIAKIDSLYTNLLIFMHFCTFDFYFTLRKFDSTIKERNFSTMPHFKPINGSYVVEDIKNFISIAWGIPTNAAWDEVFNLLKEIKGVEPVTYNNWKKILASLSDMREKRVFEMMIQILTEDPDFSETFKTEEYHIVDDYITQIRKQADSAVESVQKRQHEGKVDNLLTQIFGNSNVQQLKYYNEAGSAPLERKGCGSYMWQAPLSYLKQFLLEYTKKEIRELSDIILVRAEWSNNQLCVQMSDSYHHLLEISERLLQFDDEMAEDRAFGLKIKTQLPRVERDKDSKNIISTVLRDVNNSAANLILTASKDYISYAKNLKLALEDFVKPRPELINNWKDLDHFSEGHLKEMCVDVYKKIYLFIQLMQSFNVEVKE